MAGLGTHLGTKLAAVRASGHLGALVAGVATAACAVIVSAFALTSQFTGAGFDPTSLLGSSIGQQANPEFDAAYNVNGNSENGQANMQTNEEEKPTPEQPTSLEEVMALEYTPEENTGNTALHVVDTPTGTTVGTPSPNGIDTNNTNSPESSIMGPVVNDGGNGESGSGGNPSGGDSDKPGPTPGPNPGPDQPIIDPDPTTPTLPDDIYDNVIPTQPFPEGGVTTDPDTAPDVTFHVITDAFDIEGVYWGEVLTEQKLLCSALFYASVDGEIYHITGYSENFKVGTFPQVVNTDTLAVEFSFRLNEQSEWITQTANFAVHDCKVLVQGWDESTYIQTSYPAVGESVDLLSLYTQMIPGVEEHPEEMFILDSLFVGWTDTENGTSVGPAYTPATKGLVVLKPLPTAALPDGFYANYDRWMVDGWLPMWGQTLWACFGAENPGHIPEGIQSLSSWLEIFTDVIVVPSTLQNIGEAVLDATQEYQVAKGNTTYAAANDMLVSQADNWIIAVPSEMETVVVPADISGIDIPSINNIKRIEFSGDVLDVDFSNLHNAEVVVPADRYLGFLIAWQDKIGAGNNQLVTDSAQTPDYEVRDGAVLSKDGTTLYQVLGSNAGVYFVPDSVTTIEAGATDVCENVDTFVLPASVTHLSAGSLTGSGLERVLFEGSVSPTIEPGAFGTVRAQVQVTAYTTYLQAWSTALGASEAIQLLEANNFQVTMVDGYQLLQDDLREPDGTPRANAHNECIMLSAPANVEVFEEGSLSATATKLNTGAFRNCTNLWLVDLPASVTTIGNEAFAGCTSLQMMLSEATDTITIGANIFADCYSLRTFAFNALHADVGSGEGLYDTISSIACFAYVPCEATGYEDASPDAGMLYFQPVSPSYRVLQQNDGALLCGKGDGDLYPAGNLLLAASDVSGNVVLPAGTTYIDNYAFMGCQNAFTLDAASMSNMENIGSNAFANSGLEGAVTLPNALWWMGTGAFTGSNITSVTIEGENLIDIPEGAFSGCLALESVTFGDTCATSYLGNSAFSMTQITHLELPDSITNIGESAFSETPLTSIHLPANLERLQSFAFYGCTELTSIDLPANLMEIWAYLFEGSSITEVRVHNATPAQLVMMSYGMGFEFGNDAALHVVLAGDAAGCEDAFIAAWKYAMVGYDVGDPLTPEEDLAGQNAVRALLGMEALDALPEGEGEGTNDDAGTNDPSEELPAWLEPVTFAVENSPTDEVEGESDGGDAAEGEGDAVTEGDPEPALSSKVDEPSEPALSGFGE